MKPLVNLTEIFIRHTSKFYRVTAMSSLISWLTGLLSAQTYDSLQLLKGHKTKVYYSTGHTDRAKQIAVRCDNVLAYYKPVFGFYNDIAQKSPGNYAWYQCKLHAAAAVIYDKGGKTVIAKLWNALKPENEILTEQALISLLADKVDRSVADMQSKWFTIR